MVICFTNQKGGCGKTVTCSSVARCLHILKKAKILLIDLDPQRNLDMTLGVEVARTDLETKTLYDVLAGKAALKDVIIHGEFCDLAPASNQMYGWGIPSVLSTEEYVEHRNDRDWLLATLTERFSPEYTAQTSYRYTHLIEEQVKTVIDDYDYILIDTNPSLSLLTLNGINAARLPNSGLIIPCFCEESSREALAELRDTQMVLNANSERTIRIFGILLTKYEGKTRVARRYEKYFKHMAKSMGTIVFDQKIRQSVSVKEYVEAGTDLISYDPTCNASLDYMEFTKELLKRIKELEGK